MPLPLIRKRPEPIKGLKSFPGPGQPPGFKNEKGEDDHTKDDRPHTHFDGCPCGCRKQTPNAGANIGHQDIEASN